MDYTLPPATRQKIDGPKGGNDSQNRDDLMNRLHSLVGCLAETQQTARNDHEQKKQSGDPIPQGLKSCGRGNTNVGAEAPTPERKNRVTPPER